jgi:hypothetical protein
MLVPYEFDKPVGFSPDNSNQFLGLRKHARQGGKKQGRNAAWLPPEPCRKNWAGKTLVLANSPCNGTGVVTHDLGWGVVDNRPEQRYGRGSS